MANKLFTQNSLTSAFVRYYNQARERGDITGDSSFLTGIGKDTTSAKGNFSRVLKGLRNAPEDIIEGFCDLYKIEKKDLLDSSFKLPNVVKNGKAPPGGKEEDLRLQVKKLTADLSDALEKMNFYKEKSQWLEERNKENTRLVDELRSKLKNKKHSSTSLK